MSATLQVRHAPTVPEGDGVFVKRLMPLHGFMNYDPFVLWDHFDIGSGAGFPTHPHRGFEAITYMFSGSMQHADNLGNQSTVTAGGAQRFTAGRGLLHSEMPGEGERSSGIQLWINLPKAMKGIAPEYQQVDAADIPERQIAGGTVRMIAGPDAPVELRTEVLYLDLSLNAGSQYSDAIPDGMRGLLYVVTGELAAHGEHLAEGDALFVEHLSHWDISAKTDSRFMLCLGRPHHEPIRQHGPYVD